MSLILSLIEFEFEFDVSCLLVYLFANDGCCDALLLIVATNCCWISHCVLVRVFGTVSDLANN